MSKRIVVCFDGTWNTTDTDAPTNVVTMARAVLPSAQHGTVQVVFTTGESAPRRGWIASSAEHSAKA